MEKTKQRDTIKAALVIKTANILGVSARHVRRVINGENDNETILSVYMEVLEGETNLLKEVRRLVPIK